MTGPFAFKNETARRLVIGGIHQTNQIDIRNMGQTGEGWG